MIKLKRTFLVTLCLSILFALVFVCAGAGKSQAYAENYEAYDVYQDNGDIQPYALESMSIGLSGGDGKVSAIASNKFQIGHSTVQVYVKLYYSYSHCEDYQQMTLAASNYIEDLDSGKSISAEASTGNEERYWLGLIQYKINSGSWKEKTVSARYSASGEFLSKN